MYDANKWTTVAKRLLIVFLALQPCLDVLLNIFGDERLAVAGVSVFTIIRYLLLATAIFVGVVATIRRPLTKGFIVFLGAVLLYMAAHAWHVNGLDVLVNGDPIRQGYLESLIYLSKYLLPICVLFLAAMLRFGYTELKLAVMTAVCVTAAIVVVTNLLGVDYMAYAFGSTAHPRGSLISWFFGGLNEGNWREYTSRGLFVSGNELGGFFLLALPITLFVCLREKRWWWYVVAAVHLITMLLIGTRVAVYGAILISGLAVLIWAVRLIVTKTKLSLHQVSCIGVTMVVFLVFFAASPFASRIRSGEASIGDSSINMGDPGSSEPVEPPVERPLDKPEGKEELRAFYYENPYELYIDAQVEYGIPWYLPMQVYDYREHTEFWVELVLDRPHEIGNARELKVLVLEDVRRASGSDMTLWFGLGPTHFYPELDFVAQYYNLGIVGFALLIFPYVAVVIGGGIWWLWRIKRGQERLLTAILLATVGLLLAVGVVAGHVLLPMLVPMFLGALCGTAVTFLQAKNESECEA